jgi:hypothetical protein
MKIRMKSMKDLTGKAVAKAAVLNGTKINVGALEGEHAWLAAIHEYGCTIPVTPKMRAYLHHIGVHLRADTNQIVIPERSFLRSGFDSCHDEVMKEAEQVLPDVLFGTLSEKQYIDIVGTLLRDRIKEYAVDLKDPPKKPWPTRDPAKNNPLVETGGMINSIEYEVEQ